MKEPSLAGRVVVVTGGRRGLGAAIAEVASARGARVITTSRDAAPVTALRGDAGRSEWFLDVRDPESVGRLFAALDSAGVAPDVLVNNAGAGVFAPADQIGSDAFVATIETNVTGAFLCAREALARMGRAGGGTIVNIGSIAGETALAGGIAYGPSKAALRALSDQLRMEGRPLGVRVMHVTLGAVATEIWRSRAGFDPARMLAPRDVACIVLDAVGTPGVTPVEAMRIMPPEGILEPES